MDSNVSLIEMNDPNKTVTLFSMYSHTDTPGDRSTRGDRLVVTDDK